MIGKRLSQMISESALKKQDAAKLIGRSPGTISNWIRDENFQNNSDFFKLCRLKGWNPYWILEGQGEKYTQINAVNDKTPVYPEDSIEELKAEIKVLHRMLQQKDEYIQELIDLCREKGIKRGAHSG